MVGTSIPRRPLGEGGSHKLSLRCESDPLDPLFLPGNCPGWYFWSDSTTLITFLYCLEHCTSIESTKCLLGEITGCASAAESLCLGQIRRPEIAEALQGLGENKAEVFLTLTWHLEPSVADWGKSDLSWSSQGCGSAASPVKTWFCPNVCGSGVKRQCQARCALGSQGCSWR